MNDKVTKETQVNTQMVFLVEQTKKLEDIITQLDDRLTSILRDRQPKEEIAEKAIEQVELASKIRGQAWSIQNSVVNINSIMERLEL